MLLRTVTAASLLLVPLTAAADDSVHEFATLDRASGETSAGADLSFIVGDLGIGGFASRLDLHGQYMSKSGFGAYGQAAISKGFLDSSSDPLSQATIDNANKPSLSNVELGGQYKRALTRELSFIAHAGLVLPTASEDGFLANVLTAPRRIDDISGAIPNVTALRLGISPTWHRGAVFARADLGVDVVIDGPMETSSDPVLHANVAVGARHGKLSGALEVVTMMTTENVEPGAERFIHTGAVSMRYDAGRFSPSISVVTPLDDNGRGDAISIGAGVAAGF